MDAISQTCQRHQWQGEEHPGEGSSQSTVFGANKLCGKDVQRHIHASLEETHYSSQQKEKPGIMIRKGGFRNFTLHGFAL